MARLYRIIVTNCHQCPEFVTGECVCRIRDLYVRNPSEVPDWCPLPAAEEGEDS